MEVDTFLIGSLWSSITVRSNKCQSGGKECDNVVSLYSFFLPAEQYTSMPTGFQEQKSQSLHCPKESVE